MPRRRALLPAVLLVLAGCAAPATSSAPSEEPLASAAPTPTASPSPSAEPTPSPTVAASATVEQLLGTWRTTLGGVNLVLRLTPDT